jgi:hypothetical protein
MKTLKFRWYGIELMFPMVTELIRAHDHFVANNIQLWAPEDDLVHTGFAKVVTMTEKELAWFTRL